VPTSKGAIMQRSYSYLCHLVYASLFMALLSPCTSPAETCEKPVAKVVSVQGTVEAQRVGETPWRPVHLHDTYCPGDTLRVQERSRADVALLNQAVLRLDANTTITLEAVKAERTGVIDLLKGAAHFFSRGPRSLEVHTNFIAAGVRGTEFFIRLEVDKASLSIFEGTVVAANEAGSLTLTGGQSAVAAAGQAPVLRVVARPRDAVYWALYYPPVLYVRPDTLPPGPDWQGMVRQSVEFYLWGDLQRAFNSIANVPETVPDPRFFAYRASLLLAVGRVEEAKEDIQRVLRLRPNDPDPLALQTIIAIVQNDKDRALQVAQQAVATVPDSATAQIALSYAQQARFDLEGARASLEKAVKLDPANALAWARLAEIQSSFGELKKALKAAQKAVALEPNLARVQTVLGFAYLQQVKTQQAKEVFARAIALDQADPLPRLGLGLAQIREGHLDEGSRDLEVAASLGANNALVRSYLGKAYYEEKRTGLDEREYAVAKDLDPKDPTPWFYDAIAKQTTNRPVEALQNLQQAIELNDNRAVYRSRLLLDADLAARSASLGRIYSDLGFQQLALVEGWKSVNTDPTNFSAHRFLADSYSVLPRNEIARVSELLQSQLLQPINITPIQPRLAESNLFLISASGPAALSFNEFNPIFNRDGVAVQASGLFGEHDTFGGEGVVSGIYKQFSFSVGGSHFGTDGFRTNSDQKDDIVNAFTQLELDYKTSLQGEFRYRNTKNGDLELRFFPDDFRPNVREKAETYTYRIGLRHAFSPESIILGSFTYQHKDTTLHDEPTVPFINSIDDHFPDEKAFSGEMQYLFRSKYINLVSGIGYFKVDAKEELTLDLNLPPPPDGPGQTISMDTLDNDVKHFNLYVYSYLSLLKNVTFTLGASGDLFDTDSSATEKTNQFNPKFGVVWNPLPDTTVRAAVFRALKRTLITDQTLEPTQVAGFNQFYDDANATKSWRYGVAVDQKFSKEIFAGVEFSKRDLSIPFRKITVTTDEVRRGDANEYLGRTYLFWVPHPWLAFSTEYQYEQFNNDEDVAFAFKKVTTHRVPLGLRLFHPSGLSALLKATYINQHGDFIRRGGDSFESGSDAFWIVDAAVSYRLPKRYGFITFGVTNLFDKEFRYQETDIRNASILPSRTVGAKLTLALP
jgi:tetratricopeptide (TPR) repeat protein